MVVALIIPFVSFFYATLIGWGSHWAVHQRWMGRYYRAHMAHHTRAYPPLRITSLKYISVGKDDSLFFFAPISTLAAGIYLGALLLAGAGAGICCLAIVSSAMVGALHEFAHQAFHLDQPRIGKFRWFQAMKSRHAVHHWNVRKNLGIVYLGWDKLFGTYRD